MCAAIGKLALNATDGDGSSSEFWDIEYLDDEDADTADSQVKELGNRSSLSTGTEHEELNKQSPHTTADGPSAMGSPHHCTICGRIFTAENIVLVHTITDHSNEKLRECPICGRTFRYHSQALLHLNTHGADSFICDVCGRGFKSKGHQGTHSTAKPFECDICGRKLKYRSGLAVHRRKHTGEQPPYTCETCGNRYAHCTDLRRHLFLHGIYKRKFACSICAKIFYEPKFLRQHMKHHRD